jgi:predicted component of type VI protein secretion system
MGSFQFVVVAISIIDSSISLSAYNSTTGKHSHFTVALSDKKKTFSFGRKANNDFSFEDQHLSGIHAKIQIVNDKFILEDMSSTNGYSFDLSF